MYVKKGLPEKDELVICTITKPTPSSVFVNLDEYKGVEGMVHVSEIARKMVRAMKVYLKPKTQLVCKVMSVDAEKRFVHLSLRRVGEGQRRTKLQSWKNEKIANDILEVFAKQAGLSSKQAFAKVGYPIVEKYGGLYPAFVELSQKGSSALQDIGIEKNLVEKLTALIKKRIAPPKAELAGTINMFSPAEDGLEILKNAVSLAKEIARKSGCEIAIKYISAPKYKFRLEGPNNKKAEEAFKNLQKELSRYFAKAGGSFQAKAG